MNKLMSMSVLQLVLYALGFALLFVALLYVTYQPPKEGGAQLLNWLYMSLGILAGHILGTGQSKSSAPTAALPGQSGRSLLSFLSFVIFCGLAVAAALAMSGCTTTTASIARGYMTSAEAGVQAFDDNALEANVRLLCLTPYGAVVRHPEKQVGIQVMCGQLANTSTVDANQLQMIVNLFKSAGVTLQAAPAK